MSKPIMLVIAVLVGLGIIGAGAFLFLNKSSDNKDSNNSGGSNSSDTTSSKSSIKSLLGVGKNVTCDVKYEQGEGTIYVSDKKMSGSFEIQNDGQTYQGYMIQDGEYSYTWSSQSNQGVKFKIDAAEQPSTEQQKNGVDVDQEGEVNCRSWSVDNSKFNPPADVTFTDLTSTLNQVQTQTDQVKAQQQAACNQIADAAAKSACLDALD